MRSCTRSNRRTMSSKVVFGSLLKAPRVTRPSGWAGKDGVVGDDAPTGRDSRVHPLLRSARVGARSRPPSSPRSVPPLTLTHQAHHAATIGGQTVKSGPNGWLVVGGIKVRTIKMAGGQTIAPRPRPTRLRGSWLVRGLCLYVAWKQSTQQPGRPRM